MASISIVGPQGGEHVNLGSVKMRILEDGGTTAQRMGLTVSTLPPHTDGPAQHRHTAHDEGFYIISGTARFTSGNDVQDAPAGSLIMIPPGVPHTFANPGVEPMMLLTTFSPAFYVQYFRDIDAMIAQGRPMTHDSLAELMARYATEPSASSADAE